MKIQWPKDVRWFDSTGTCRCGKPANGILRGLGNASYGAACLPCANKLLNQLKSEATK